MRVFSLLAAIIHIGGGAPRLTFKNKLNFPGVIYTA